MSSSEPSSATQSFVCLTWNIEGLKRNKSNLKHFSANLPDFIFLSEPQIFQCDLAFAMEYFCGEYSCSLNSRDLHEPDLAMTSSKAHGGTMALWRKDFDPFVTICKVETTAFLPLVFSPPNRQASIHVTVYMPTSGKDDAFMEDLAMLHIFLQEAKEKYLSCPIFLRGDFNVNRNNLNRSSLLNHLISDHALSAVSIPHPTYHHFTGNGSFDSNLDCLLHSSSLLHTEKIITIHCKLQDPLVNSHHDIIISTFSLIASANLAPTTENNINAPKVENTRTKIVWSESGVKDYQKLVSSHLQKLQDRWLDSSSKSSVSILLHTTNQVMNIAASATNKPLSLSKTTSKNSSSSSREVQNSQKSLKREHRKLKNPLLSCSDYANLKQRYKESKKQHRRLDRWCTAKESIVRCENLSTAISDPSNFHKYVRNSKQGTNKPIQKLTVGDRVYLGDHFSDGFYDSISNLKTIDPATIANSSTFHGYNQDYKNILDICQNGDKIPAISFAKSSKILDKIRPDVNDFFSITARHYINAGDAGYKHFCLLLNVLIEDVNNITLSEINTVYACILFKGHNKDKTSDRSYRTISTCPLVSKGLDLYVCELNISAWKDDKADTQFQAEGSSHELAALLLTETIQHSLFSDNKSVFALYLDAMSAFDNVLQQLLVKNLFCAGTHGHSLLYINKAQAA